MLREPLTLGHESAGVVAALGSKITDFKVGDKVVLEVGIPCGACDLCSKGRYNLCKEMRFRSSAKSVPHAQGTLQERINHPAQWCYTLPKAISMDLGALLEPLGVATNAVRRARLETTHVVLVYGAGAVGLLCAFVAKQKGARLVVIADIDEGRANFAFQNGFADQRVILPAKRGQSIDENLEIAKSNATRLKAGLGFSDRPREFDLVFECTGVESCVQASIYASKAGGRIMLIGMGTPVQTLPLSAAALREVDLCGVFRYADTYPEGIEMVSKQNRLELEKLVTHRFVGLENAQKAFKMAGNTTDDEGNLVLKVVVDIPENQART